MANLRALMLPKANLIDSVEQLTTLCHEKVIQEALQACNGSGNDFQSILNSRSLVLVCILTNVLPPEMVGETVPRKAPKSCQVLGK